MNRIFRTTLCVVFTLAFVLSFAACSDKADVKEPTEKVEETDTQAEAKKTVENFMNAYCELDIEKMSGYCVDSAAFVDSIGYKNVEDIVIAGMKANGTDDRLAGYMTPFAKGIIDIIKDRTEYKVVKIKEDGDGYIATVEYSMPNSKLAMSTFENIMDSDDVEELGEEIAVELVENGTITSDSTEEEIIEALMAEVINRLLPEIAEEIEVVERITNTIDIKVVEKDGKWYVDESIANVVKEYLEN